MIELKKGVKIKRNGGQQLELLEIMSGDGMVRQLWLCKFLNVTPVRMEPVWLLSYRDYEEVTE